MTAKEVRAIVKKIIIAQGGKIYNFNIHQLLFIFTATGEVQSGI